MRVYEDFPGQSWDNFSKIPQIRGATVVHFVFQSKSVADINGKYNVLSGYKGCFRIDSVRRMKLICHTPHATRFGAFSGVKLIYVKNIN
jgi:hypothetical protein